VLSIQILLALDDSLESNGELSRLASNGVLGWLEASLNFLNKQSKT
jgi:hypothetical protein